MKSYKHIGSYGLIFEKDKILLITKNGGPYDGKLGLPGGTIEIGETPDEALVREMKEEVGINISSYNLYDVDSVTFKWIHKGEEELCHHIGVFYKIISYENEIKNEVEIDTQNDDSFGAQFYKISQLKEFQLSKIAIVAINKLGYKLNK